MSSTATEPVMVETAKGTEYVVLVRESPKEGWHQIPGGSTYTTQTKEEAVKAGYLATEALDEECEFKAVPMSSWRETFEIDPEPRVRRKK